MFHTIIPPKPKAVCPWVTMDSSILSRLKMKMTRPWMDYLLCQLSAEKPLSTLETLPPELLEPILEELHSNSIIGVRAFARASRTCRALASPYFFKPMRAHLDETPYAVLLSATEGYKTLKVHSPSLVVPDWEYLRSHGEQWEQEYPTVSSILNIESTFTCIELRIGREAYRSYNRSIPTFPLDILKSGCPMISKLNIELDEFRGYSMGWDWYSCEAAKVPWPMRTPMKSAYNDVAISRIARFANLQYLTTHFFISTVVVGVMGPRQKRQAAFDFYKSIEKQKCGVRLDRLDVVFYIGEHFDWKNYAVKDVEPLVTVTVCPLEKPKGHCRYRVTCEDTRSEEVLCRTTKTLGLGGLVLPFGCPCPTLECNHSTISSLRKALVNTSAKTLLSPFGLRRSENEEAVWPFDVDTLEYE